MGKHMYIYVHTRLVHTHAYAQVYYCIIRCQARLLQFIFMSKPSFLWHILSLSSLFRQLLRRLVSHPPPLTHSSPSLRFMRHLAQFYSSTSLPAILPLWQAAYAQYFSFACCLQWSSRPCNSSSRQLVISSSSPSSYSQLNVHFSVKQAVKWHFRWRSSRRFVSFGSPGSPGVRLLVWLLRAVPAFLYAA